MITTSCWNNRDRFAISAGIFALGRAGDYGLPKNSPLNFVFKGGLFLNRYNLIRGKLNILHIRSI